MNYLQIEKPLFGKSIKIGIFNVDKGIGEELLNESYDYARRLEKIFNFYDPQSELSLLNKNREKTVSKDLLFVLKKAISFSKLTKGKYDITKGRNFLERKAKKDLTYLDFSYKDIKIKGKTVSLRNQNVLIDLGSIAKGYIGDKIVEFIQGKGVKEGIIDARGDLIFFGKMFHEVSIQHPRKKELSIGSIKVRNEAIATSGDYNQYDKSFEKSHILNQEELSSITVITKKLVDADAIATCLFLMNKNEREKFLRKNKKIKVFAVNKELNTKKYNFSNEN